jgi:hypothetical protein
MNLRLIVAALTGVSIRGMRWHRDEGSASQASLTRPGKGRYARRASWSDEWRATFRTFTSDEFGTTAHLSNFEFPACWHRKLNGSTVRWGRFDTLPSNA